ncbi:MAG: RHS repeat domain-containing protein, partial [Candidatus Tyrphobacter sp.]
TYGNLQTYNSGNGTWHLTYDSLNRVLAREDPDSVYSYVCYFADGSTHYAETAYQHSLDGNPSGCAATPPGIYASAFTYDADGDVTKQTAVHGGTYVSGSAPTLPTTQGITQKFYDADDRLVEVEQPYDATSDTYTNPWITRYLYDLSQNGTQGSIAFNGQSIAAHGNLYKTVELLPPGTAAQTITYSSWPPSPAPTPIPNTVYQDLKGTAFDALDRPTAKYSLVYNSGTQTDALNAESLTYDSDPTRLGLLSEDCNQLSQCQTFTYDARGSEGQVQFSDSTPSRTMTYDPDGRVISITSSVFGTQSYRYDADGRLSTSEDPSGGGVTSPALLTHHYYADGKEESLDVSSSALTQAGLFAYSYRADGRVQTQAIDDASIGGIVNAGSTTLSYTYTAAGRTTQRSESGAAANSTPVTEMYNGYGQEAGEIVPGGALSSFEYSAENEDLGMTTSASQAYARYTYTTRGELISWPASSGYAPSARYANGVQVQAAGGVGITQVQATWDSRMGVVLGTSATQNDTVVTSGSIYDAAGRLTTDDQNGDSITRTYDAENHTLVSSLYDYSNGNGAPTAFSMLWGPNGHPIMIGSGAQGTYQYDTLHWNGNVLLFTTNSAGQLDDIKIGAQGDILPLDSGYKGLTFYDRDPSGGVMGCHNAAGATFRGVSNSYTINTKYGEGHLPPCGGSSMPTSINWWGSPLPIGPSPWIGQGGVLGMPRTDGYTDNTDTIQGVRTYGSNAGTWTTPDAYGGNVDNPASQKSYMWNGNNPEAYGDPSGYLTPPPCDSICGDSGDGSGTNASVIQMLNATNSHAITSLPTVVSPSDATIQPLTQSQMTQIRQEVDNGQTSGFGSETAAAYAAAYKYAGRAQYARICKCGIEEVGALIYKDPKTKTYGFGAPIMGSGSAVAAQVVASITASSVAIWHSHTPPNDESSLDLESHVREILATGLDFYTTMRGGTELWGQDYNPAGGVIDDVKICGVGNGVQSCDF